MEILYVCFRNDIRMSRNPIIQERGYFAFLIITLSKFYKRCENQKTKQKRKQKSGEG